MWRGGVEDVVCCGVKVLCVGDVAWWSGCCSVIRCEQRCGGQVWMFWCVVGKWRCGWVMWRGGVGVVVCYG